MFKPLPLASSNGCQTTTKNFQLVVKGTVSEGEEDGREQIELEFSDNYGESYYTDDKECPLSYVARKLNDDEMRRARTRALGVIFNECPTVGEVIAVSVLLGFSAVEFTATCLSIIGYYTFGCRWWD